MFARMEDPPKVNEMNVKTGMNWIRSGLLVFLSDRISSGFIHSFHHSKVFPGKSNMDRHVIQQNLEEDV